MLVLSTALAGGVFAGDDQPGYAGLRWKDLKSTHFIIFHLDSAVPAREISRASETYYHHIAKQLGYQRIKNFWLFENRCAIYIYPDRKTFQTYEPEAPSWSGGFADYKKRRIVSYAGSENFAKTTLPHELAHLILAEYLGAEADLPMWLNEGVALSQEGIRRAHLEDMVWGSFQSRTFIPVSKLAQMRVTLAKHHGDVELYYAESALLVEHLLRNSRSGEFTTFCRNLRDGFAVDDALFRSYGERLKSLEHLEESFMADLASRFQKQS